MPSTRATTQAKETLRKKCPYSELFWSVFSAFGLNTEKYGSE